MPLHPLHSSFKFLYAARNVKTAYYHFQRMNRTLPDPAPGTSTLKPSSVEKVGGPSHLLHTTITGHEAQPGPLHTTCTLVTLALLRPQQTTPPDPEAYSWPPDWQGLPFPKASLSRHKGIVMTDNICEAALVGRLS